jgi:hypothetical protein
MPLSPNEKQQSANTAADKEYYARGRTEHEIHYAVNGTGIPRLALGNLGQYHSGADADKRHGEKRSESQQRCGPRHFGVPDEVDNQQRDPYYHTDEASDRQPATHM